MALLRRARVIRARRESAPAFDVLRLSQPKAYSGVLRSVLKSYGSESAILGPKIVDTLRDTSRPPMAMAKVLRTASVMQGVFKMLLPSDLSVPRAMSALIAFVRRRQRWYISLAVQLRETLVNVLSAAGLSAQSWMRSPALGGRPFPLPRAGRLRKCAETGCEKCKRRTVMSVRVAPQIARRFVGFGQRGAGLVAARPPRRGQLAYAAC